MTDAVVDVGGDDSVLKIYPNPLNDYFTVELNDNSISSFSVDVYDVSGRRVVLRVGVQNFEPLQMSLDLPSGIYFLKITTADKIFIRKIIKEY